jgi:hypothetical protein
MVTTRSKTKGSDVRSKGDKRWVAKVKTVSTFPPKSIFTKDAKTIAKAMESKQVSPKGIGSGIRMIQYFINRAGKNLSATRKQELERAKRLLQEKQQQRSPSSQASRRPQASQNGRRKSRSR